MAVTCLAGLLPAVKANASYSDVLQAVTVGLLLWAVGDTSGLPLVACIVAVSLLSGTAIDSCTNCNQDAGQVDSPTIKAAQHQLPSKLSLISVLPAPQTVKTLASSEHATEGASSIPECSTSSSSTQQSLPPTAECAGRALARPPPGFSHVQPLPQRRFSASLPEPAATPQHQWNLPASDAVGLEGLCHPSGQPCLLGEGGMGKVELMQDARSGALLAIKSPLLRGSHILPHTAANVEREHAANAELTTGALHPHVVRYLGPVSAQGQLNGSLAFEYLPGGCLTNNLEFLFATGNHLPLAARAQLLLHVCKGLRSIHDRGLVHADLKMDNILLDRPFTLGSSPWQGVAKVADLGLSRPVDAMTGLVQYSGGTLPYMAPELFDGSPASQAVDVYAFGMLMWELFHLQQAHGELPDAALIAAMAGGGLLPGCSSAVEPEYRAIMLACLESDPFQRPSVAVLQRAIEMLLL